MYWKTSPFKDKCEGLLPYWPVHRQLNTLPFNFKPSVERISCVHYAKNNLHQQVQNSTLVFIGYVPDALKRLWGRTIHLFDEKITQKLKKWTALTERCIIKVTGATILCFYQYELSSRLTNYASTSKYTISVRHQSAVQLTENTNGSNKNARPPPLSCQAYIPRKYFVIHSSKLLKTARF